MADADRNRTSGFLARWARRKAETQTGDPHPEVPPQAASKDVDDESTSPHPSRLASLAPQDEGLSPEELEARLATLPKLEDITPSTDITGFLQSWVPGALREAALRRAWSSDPRIANFIEVADYQMDWNIPGGAPGCGPLEPDFDVQGFLKNLFAEADGKGKFSPPRDLESQPVENVTSEVGAAAQQGPTASLTQDLDDGENRGEKPVFSDVEPHAAAQQNDPEPPSELPPRRRSHGRALPKA